MKNRLLTVILGLLVQRGENNPPVKKGKKTCLVSFLSFCLLALVPLAIVNSSNASEPNSDLIVQTGESGPEVESDLDALTDDWYTYTAQDGSYTVKFPGEPFAENSNQATYGDQVLAYMTQINDFSDTADFSQIRIEDIFGAIRSSLGKDNAIEREAEISHNGHSGIELTIRRKDGFALKMRIFFDINERKLYQAIVGSATGDVSVPQAEAFLDSFELAQ